MRLVVSGYYGCGNTGDEAVLAGLLASLRAADPSLEATVVSGDPAATLRAHDVAAVPRMRPAPLWRALRRADGLVSGGGGLLQDRTSARPVTYYAGVMALARAARRPYAVHAQGLGPIERRANRAIAAAALRAATHVSLRDPASVALARVIGVRRPIDLVPDPAIVLEPPRAGGGHVLVAPRAWGASPAPLAALRVAMGELAARHPVLALPMHEPVDRRAAGIVIEGVPGAEVLSPDTDLPTRLATIGGAALVVGMRLHALVLAVAAGIPAVAISYDPKVDAFAAEAGIEVGGSVDGGVDPRAVIEAAERALAEDPAVRADRVGRMRREAHAAAGASLAALSRT